MEGVAVISWSEVVSRKEGTLRLKWKRSCKGRYLASTRTFCHVYVSGVPDTSLQRHVAYCER